MALINFLFDFIDIFVSMVSSNHCICAKGYYIAIVSTQVETDSPENEIQPAIKLLGAILEMFVSVVDTYKPLEKGTNNGLWVTKSYDPSSHFEIAADDILDIYQIHNKRDVFDLLKIAEQEASKFYAQKRKEADAQSKARARSKR